VVRRPVGPPKIGIDGFTWDSALFGISISAKSLKAQALGLVSPAFCIASQEL
jgi:hypothetical protein